MRFPNKVTSYKESSIALFPVILGQLENNDMTPSRLYSKVKGKMDIREFAEILDCLYALGKIELQEEALHYVG